MNSQVRVRHRMNVILQMVMALIAAILLAQLWLFTVTLDAMENDAVSMNVAVAAVVCSFAACGTIWILIKFFLQTEQTETGD